MAERPERLLVVSHVMHFRFDKRLFAYGPYAREIDVWADLFPEVLVAAPCRDAVPDRDCLPFTRSNIAISPQPETGGTTLRAKVAQLLALPRLIWSLCAAMRKADAVHVRCPGNLGLLGVVLAPLFTTYLVAKFAGQWDGGPTEPWSVRLQRALLRSRWWRGPVTVYGSWPHQPKHVVPFFTSVLSTRHLERARAAATSKQLSVPLRLLHVGRLSASKNVDVLLEAVAYLRRCGLALQCVIAGDGPERLHLDRKVAEMDLQDTVTFTGAIELDVLLAYYEQAHVLVLASESEGWPKAIAEGMAFGLVCIGSDRGFPVEMLGRGRGVLVPPRHVRKLADALRRIAERPEDYASMSRRAAEWGQKYSLTDLREALARLLSAWWGVHIRPRSERARTTGDGPL